MFSSLLRSCSQATPTNFGPEHSWLGQFRCWCRILSLLSWDSPYIWLNTKFWHNRIFFWSPGCNQWSTREICLLSSYWWTRRTLPWSGKFSQGCPSSVALTKVLRWIPFQSLWKFLFFLGTFFSPTTIDSEAQLQAFVIADFFPLTVQPSILQRTKLYV